MKQTDYKKSPPVSPDTIKVGKVYKAKGITFKILKRARLSKK